jgi:O-antigen/teichoic acid export membrane protein
MVLFKLADRLLGLASTVLLARLLVPADFGIVAMATSIIALIEVAAAFSFDVALIQRAHPTREHYDTAWTMNVLLGAACGALMAALAYPSALFYNEPRLTGVVLVLAAAWFVQNVENIGVVDFRREMNFAKEFRFLATKRATTFVLTIALALALRNYWALVASTLFGRLAGVAVSFYLSAYRPRWSLSARRDLLSFSKWLPVTSALSFVQARLSHFFIGRLKGPTDLGVYTIAAEFASLAATEIVAPINRAVLPGFARMLGDRTQMRRGFLDVTAAIAALAFPAGAGIAVVAEPLVLVVLGPKWSGAIPIIEILAWGSCVTAVASHNYSAYLALGRTEMTAMVGALRAVLLVPLLVLLPGRLGLPGFAWAEVSSMATAYLLSCALLFRLIGLNPVHYLARLWRPAAATAGMAVLVGAALRLAPVAIAAPWLQLAAGIATGVLTYAALSFALWFASGRPHGIETLLLDRARRFLLPLGGAGEPH